MSVSAPRLRARARPGQVALAWAAATFVVLALLSGGPGISRDEAAVLAPLRGGRPAPAPLAAAVAAAGRAVGTRAGLSEVRAARLGSAAAGAGLSAILSLLAGALGGPAAAALAPALFWLAPRHLHAGLVATPDVLAAALWLGALFLYRSATREPIRSRRVRAALAAGLLFGGALSARPDTWVLLVVVALHAAIARLTTPRARRDVTAAAPPRDLPTETGIEARLHGVPLALAAMAILGPAILVAVSWSAGGPTGLRALPAALLGRGGATWEFLGAPLAGRFPPAYPLVVTALTVPAALLLAYLAGLFHAAARAVRGWRGDARREAADEVLLVLAALVPVAAAAAGVAPASAGIRPWLAAFPVLAVLASRTLLWAAEEAWPSRAAPLAASLALLVLWPGLRATAHAHPAGASAWNELAGGAPGAASLGMQRQDGGEAAVEVLAEVNARARPGAAVWWPTTAPEAVRAYTRDGRLRDDLAVADGPREADVVVVTLDGTSRDPEYRVWAEFRSARPVGGRFLDEVPLALVYARPGAWR